MSATSPGSQPSQSQSSPPKPPTPAPPSGPGLPADVLEGFIATAATLAAAPVTADPNVSAAVALGWLVGDTITWTTYSSSSHVAEVPELSSTASRWTVLIDQITARCQQLHTHLINAGSELDLSAQLQSCAALKLDSAGADPTSATDEAIADKRSAVEQLHQSLVEVLWSTEPGLGKGYVLGHRIEQMCAEPTAAPNADPRQSVTEHAPDVHDGLLKLASKLPSNSAHAVDNSLRLWWASLDAGGRETAADLLQQGWRWREVLAGEVAAKDGLLLSDYVGAAGGVTRQLRDLAKHAVKTFAIWLILALALIGVGIYLLAIDKSGSVGAGVVTVVTALGLTWKGIGEFFGRAAANGEARLWDAELDWAIAYRLTALRNPPSAWQLSRWSNELSCDLPTKRHLRRYKEWKGRWPDVDDWLQGS